MTELTKQKAEYFAQEARAYLVDKAMEMVEMVEIGGEYPFLMKDMRLLELVEVLEGGQNPYPDEESLLEAIDSIRINIVTGLVPVEANEHYGDDIDVVNQIYTPLPGGGDTQSYLGQNIEGNPIWKKMPKFKASAELVDGEARLRWNGKRWEWTTDGLQYFDLWYKSDAESILDDNLISDKKGWSSKKISDELTKKVSVRAGYALSKNDFTDELKNLLGVLKISTTTPKKLLCMDGQYRSVDELGFSNNTNTPANLVYDSLTIRDLDDSVKQAGQQCIVKNITGDPQLPSGATVLWGVYYWDGLDAGKWVLMILGAQVHAQNGMLTHDHTTGVLTTDPAVSTDPRPKIDKIGSAILALAFWVNDARTWLKSVFAEGFNASAFWVKATGYHFLSVEDINKKVLSFLYLDELSGQIVVPGDIQLKTSQNGNKLDIGQNGIYLYDYYGQVAVAAKNSLIDMYDDTGKGIINISAAGNTTSSVRIEMNSESGISVRDNTAVKKGLQLRGFGELADGSGGTYNALAPNSLAPVKWVKDYMSSNALNIAGLPEDFFVSTSSEGSLLNYKTDAHRTIDLQPLTATVINNTNEIVRNGNDLFIVGNFGFDEATTAIAIALYDCYIEENILKYRSGIVRELTGFSSTHGLIFHRGSLFLSNRVYNFATNKYDKPLKFAKVNPYNLADLKVYTLPDLPEFRGGSNDIVAYKDRIFVLINEAHYVNARLVSIDTDLTEHRLIGTLPSRVMVTPPIAICHNELYVIGKPSGDNLTIGVHVYDLDGNLIREAPATLLDNNLNSVPLPHWVTVFGGKVLVTTLYDNNLARIDAKTLALEEVIHIPGIITDDNSVTRDGYMFLNMEYHATYSPVAKLLKIKYNNFVDYTVEKDPYGTNGKGSYGSVNYIPEAESAKDPLIEPKITTLADSKLSSNVALKTAGDLIINKGTLNRTVKITDLGIYMSRTSDGAYTAFIEGSASGELLYGSRHNHIFQTIGTTKLRLWENGDIGIGTGDATPTAKLEVKTDVAASVVLKVQNINAARTADLQQWLDSAGNAVANVDVNGQIMTPSFHVRAGNGRGLRFWDGSQHYSIFMSGTGDPSWGKRLDSSSDFNMYFRMTSGTNRGFVFQNGIAPVAQIDGAGNLYMKGEVKQGITVTGPQNIAPSFMVGIDEIPASEKTKLDTAANWDVNGTYIGTPLVNCFQGQEYYTADGKYYIRMAQDNSPRRMALA